ncbi:helix-turn-helix domain-containing protein [Ferrimicrobium sp.]|uniref:helix-turn-helix domain-containing protein n=1 Tax=Ferrimicrobium sp. TaxID=2926050 RepID=UPI00260B8D02|nr:helix-turn-helix domain-containing protein [Ferrimicrobium sp.]
MDDLGRRIRTARVGAGLSQAQLARRAGTSQPAVNRYEKGRKVPSEETAERLLMACRADIRPSELLANNRERVRSLARAHGAERVLVFGSVARGEDNADSDLDLLVEIPTDRIRLFELFTLGHEISEILGIKVDIGTPEMLRPSIRERVLAEARPL